MSLTAYLSTEEAAEYLGITVHALRMSLHRGHLRPTGRIGQRLLFSMGDLDEQVQQNLQKKPVCLPVAANDDEETPKFASQNAPKKASPAKFGSFRDRVNTVRNTD